MGVGGEGRNEAGSGESNPRESIVLEQVMDRCWRRARATFLSGAVSTDLTLRTMDSRSRLEPKNPTNVPKWNKPAYPVSFNSLREVMSKNVG